MGLTPMMGRQPTGQWTRNESCFLAGMLAYSHVHSFHFSETVWPVKLSEHGLSRISFLLIEVLCCAVPCSAAVRVRFHRPIHCLAISFPFAKRTRMWWRGSRGRCSSVKIIFSCVPIMYLPPPVLALNIISLESLYSFANAPDDSFAFEWNVNVTIRNYYHKSLPPTHTN